MGAALLLAIGGALTPVTGPVAQAATAPPPLKVVTFNTCGQSSCQSTLSTADWASSMRRAITAYDADVVELQELCDGQGKAIAAAMPGYSFHFLQAVTLSPTQQGCVKWGGDGTAFGAGMLVKSSEAPSFNDQVLMPADPTVEHRPLICAEATLSGQPYQACDVHLDGGVGGLKAQGLPQVVNRMQYWGQGRPTVLAGDFNADPTDPNLGLLYSAQDGNGTFTEAEQGNQAYFAKACRQLTACRSGEPTTLDGRKFDYIFSSGADFTTAAADTVVVTDANGNDITKNDHKMYRATLNFSPDTQAPSAPQVFDNPATVRDGNTWANAVDRTAGDFTHSGKSDLVLRYANGTVMRYGHKADGSFDAGHQLVSSANGGWSDAASITAGDFNGDGYADLLVRWNVGSVFLYPNDGTGRLGNSVPLLPAWSWSNAVDVTSGHVFGLADSDIVVRWKDSTVSAFQIGQNADGTWSLGGPQQLTLAGQSTLNNVVSLTTGDFNGDGYADLLARGTDGSLTLYLNDGTGNFPQPGIQVTDGRDWTKFKTPSFSWKAVEDITAGDFNGDGKDDVIVHWMNQYQSGTPGGGQTELLLSQGVTPGLFGAPSVLKWASPGWWTNASDLLVGDVDGDGKADLVIRRPGQTTFELGTGSGGFKADQQLGPNGYFDWASSLAVGNFTTGAHLELLARSATTAGVYQFTTSQPSTPPPGIPGLGAADLANAVDVVAGHFYGGPLSDLVIRNSDGSVLLYQNTGGAFAAPTVVRSAGGWTDAVTLTAGDYNGDGKDDLLVRWHAGSAFLYPGDGQGHFGGSVPVKAAGDLSDLVDVGQGTVYGPTQGTKTLYRWADGSLLVDGNGTANLAAPAAPTASGAQPQFTFRASDDRGRVASFQYSLDGGAPVSLDAFHNTLTVQLDSVTPGAHTLSVTAVDPAGNRSATTTYSFTDS